MCRLYNSDYTVTWKALQDSNVMWAIFVVLDKDVTTLHGTIVP